MDWRVLDKQDGKVLLLKDNSLGSTPFDETGKMLLGNLIRS